MEAQPAATTIEVASGTIVEARGITRDFRSGNGHFNCCCRRLCFHACILLT